MPANDASGANGSRKFYFMLTFWGEEFRDYFYSLLLPTLLAPDNVPVLKSRPGSKLIVCTTSEDWSALKRRPLMRELAAHVEPLPLFIGYPEAGAAIQLHMSKGHRLAARRAYQDQAVAGFLAPDLLCSDGLIKTAVELIEFGKKAVVCPALRFNMEAVLGRVRAAGFLKPDRPAALSPSFMGSVAANGLHPEILRYDFDGREFDNYPIWSFWRVPQRDGLILYTVSWALLLADYGAIPLYADETLNESTIDGYYVSRNFGHLRESNQVALLNDTTHGTFTSLTPEKEFDFSWYNRRARIINAIFGLLRLGTVKRLYEISKFHRSADLDPWRRWLYSVPVTIHGDAIDSTYDDSVARTGALMQSAFNTHESWQFALTAAILFVLRWTVYLAMASVHFTRRALHIVSFGALYYPGSSGENLRLVLRRLRSRLLGTGRTGAAP